ncbi:MAG: ABC transporter ATP-binding protein [Methanosarcina sp.]
MQDKIIDSEIRNGIRRDEIIRYENVEVSFKNKQVISSFSILILKGEKVLLRGKSGTGKSTLFKMLLGFEKPSKGAIYYKGSPLTPDLVWKIRKEVSYISQDTDLGEGSVKALLEEIFSFHPNRGKDNPEKLKGLMQELELEKEILEKYFENLSGGEKQRIGILVALMLGREIFLLDEATSALDSELKEKVVNYFLKNSNWTLFIISHDIEWEREGVKVVEIERKKE